MGNKIHAGWPSADRPYWRLGNPLSQNARLPSGLAQTFQENLLLTCSIQRTGLWDLSSSSAIILHRTRLCWMSASWFNSSFCMVSLSSCCRLARAAAASTSSSRPGGCFFFSNRRYFSNSHMMLCFRVSTCICTARIRNQHKKPPKVSRRKEIIKVRAEINEKEMKETVAKINKTKSWFFEKINKIWQAISQTLSKKGRRLKPIKLEMKKGKLQQTTPKYKNHKRLLLATIWQ